MPYLITSCNGQTHLGGELGLVLFNQSFRYSLGLARERSSASLFPRSGSNSPLRSRGVSSAKLPTADLIVFLL